MLDISPTLVPKWTPGRNKGKATSLYTESRRRGPYFPQNELQQFSTVMCHTTTTWSATYQWFCKMKLPCDVIGALHVTNTEMFRQWQNLIVLSFPSYITAVRWDRTVTIVTLLLSTLGRAKYSFLINFSAITGLCGYLLHCVMIRLTRQRGI